MTAPHVKPKHDFAPATKGTAFRHADTMADEVYKWVLTQSKKPRLAMKFRVVAFTQAVDGAGLLQKFLNERKRDDKQC